MNPYPPPTLDPYPVPIATLPVTQEVVIENSYSLQPQGELSGIEITSFIARPVLSDLSTGIFIILIFIILLTLLKWSIND